MKRLPFHAVLRGDLAKVRRDNSSILFVGKRAFVRTCAKVFLALGFDQLVQADLSLSLLDGETRHGMDQGEGEKSE